MVDIDGGKRLRNLLASAKAYFDFGVDVVWRW